MRPRRQQWEPVHPLCPVPLSSPTVPLKAFRPTPFMCGIGGLAHGMSWNKNPQPWELSSTPWELSSTASIFDGAGDRKKEMLRKKYHVVRKKTHVVRKIFYVASPFFCPRPRLKKKPWKKLPPPWKRVSTASLFYSSPPRKK